MKKALITMFVMFAFTIWQLLSGILGGGVQESFLYPLYGGVILLAGLIVVCTELILEEIKSLKADIKSQNVKH